MHDADGDAQGLVELAGEEVTHGALAADDIESGLDVAGSLIIWGGLTYAGR